MNLEMKSLSSPCLSDSVVYFPGFHLRLSLGLAAVVFAACASLPIQRERPDLLRVMTYNIFWGKYGLDNVAAAIRAHRPDIVLLQEVERGAERSGGVDQFQFIRSELGWNGTYAAAHRYASGGEYGVAILTPIEIVDTHSFPLPEIPGHKNRILLRVRVVWEGKIVSFYTAHLVAWGHGRWTARKDRLRQAEAIRAIMDSDPHPKILTGDFNTSARSQAFEVLAEGMTDAWDAAGLGWWGATSYSFFPLLRIDHVLVDPRFEVIRCYVGHSRASDHLPVIADLLPK